MTSGDLLSALEPVVRALEELGVRYFVGGSLASSVYGVPRASIDADVVAELEQRHVAPLLARLAGAYYVDEEKARAAIRARRSFNLIHLGTVYKVDLFVTRGRPFDRLAFERARPRALDERDAGHLYAVASPEDTILAKLEWFRLGREVSERQWSDVVGMIRAGGEALDRQYLETWAAALGVEDLLKRAFSASQEDVRSGGG